MGIIFIQWNRQATFKYNPYMGRFELPWFCYPTCMGY